MTSYVVSDLECVIRIAKFSVSHREGICPSVGEFLFQVLSDVMMRSYACLMVTSDLAL